MLYNGILVSWACKKQPVTALQLHKGAIKTVLLHSFLHSIGFPLSSASPTYEDNTGTIKLIRTNCLTDTVCHHAVKISWLNEHYLNYNIKMANTKTSLMLVDCNTKPVHYHDLQLDKYSWTYRQQSILKKSLHNKSMPFIQH
jgi:hypothetical protein